jgi:CysZ protein
VGLIRGLAAPFRGAAFVAKHGLWGYVALPLFVNLGLAVLSGAIAFWGVSNWSASHDSVWWQLGTVLLSLVLTVPVFLILYPVVSSPFIDVLTEKTELIVKGGHPTAGLVAGAAQAILHGVAKSALYLLALAMTVGLSLVSGPGALLGVMLGALFMAYDGFDFPLARRRVAFADKWKYLFSRPGQTVGYCLSASLVYALPLAFIVIPPFLAVGATLVYLDEQR